MGCKCFKKKKKHSVNGIEIEIEASIDSQSKSSQPDELGKPSEQEFRRNKDVLIKIEKKTFAEVVFSPKSKKLLYDHKDKFICLFCGGDTCKHENWKNHKNPAIIGLNSDEITPEIFASQRPSTCLIKQYNLIQKFKEKEIGLIVNLQLEGEHPICGPNKGLESSGFSYNPSDFICEDINCKISGWQDMSVPESMVYFLDIVKEMANTTKCLKKKVLVHCHAGYGRTGMVIACYMIYTSNRHYVEVIQHIRRIRPQSVQKLIQEEFIEKFYQFIVEARQVFVTNNQKLTIEKLISNQNDLSYGDDLTKYRYIPKILPMILNQIIAIKNSTFVSSRQIHKNFHTAETWNQTFEEILYELKICVNKGKYESISEIDNIPILVELLYDWLEYNVVYVFDIIKLAKLLESEAYKIDPAWKGTFHECIIQNIDNVENRLKINNYLKREMRSIEYECLICIAEFLNEIYPEFDEDSSNFNESLENICFRLFGFKHQDIYATKDLAKAENILIVSRKFMDLFEFVIVLLKNELPNNEQLFKKTSYSSFSKLGATFTNMNLSHTKMFNFSENDYRQILNASLMNTDKDKFMINKEKFMLNIYQSLGKYFSNSLEGNAHYRDVEQNNNDIEEFFLHFQKSLERFNRESLRSTGFNNNISRNTEDLRDEDAELKTENVVNGGNIKQEENKKVENEAESSRFISEKNETKLNIGNTSRLNEEKVNDTTKLNKLPKSHKVLNDQTDEILMITPRNEEPKRSKDENITKAINGKIEGLQPEKLQKETKTQQQHITVKEDSPGSKSKSKYEIGPNDNKFEFSYINENTDSENINDITNNSYLRKGKKVDYFMTDDEENEDNFNNAKALKKKVETEKSEDNQGENKFSRPASRIRKAGENLVVNQGMKISSKAKTNITVDKSYKDKLNVKHKSPIKKFEDDDDI